MIDYTLNKIRIVVVQTCIPLFIFQYYSVIYTVTFAVLQKICKRERKKPENDNELIVLLLSLLLPVYIEGGGKWNENIVEYLFVFVFIFVVSVVTAIYTINMKYTRVQQIRKKIYLINQWNTK